MMAICLILSLSLCGVALCEAAESEVPAPWTEVESAEAAAEGAGVGYFMIPEENTETDIGPLNWYSFEYINGVAEASGAIGTAEIWVRKGLNEDGEDVSGDETEYAVHVTVTPFEENEEGRIDGFPIECYGNADEQWMKMIWVSDNFSYSIVIRGQGDLYDTFGISTQVLLSLYNEIQ